MEVWRTGKERKIYFMHFESGLSFLRFIIIIIIYYFSLSLLFYEHHEILYERLNKLWKYFSVISTNTNEQFFQFPLQENTHFKIHPFQMMLMLTWTLSETIKCVYVMLDWHESFQNILFDTKEMQFDSLYSLKL